jgi:2-hydroxychromene-2-carboxylate isomerase
MSLEFDLFWSFRSPYSYLGTRRLVAIEREYDVTIRVRPVYPLAIRQPSFFEHADPRMPMYALRDTMRVAEFLGIPYHWPRPDPIIQEFPSRKIAAEQPYIERLTRLGIEAVARGRGLPYIHEVSQVIWDGTVDGWDQGTHLADAAKRAGLDLADMDRAVAADPEGHEAVVQENQRALADAGHWGVPTMVFEGEPFFGQDRIELLVWRMKQRGLQPR